MQVAVEVIAVAVHEVPGWLGFNPAELKATVNAVPAVDEVPFDVNTNLIVEFYR